MSSSPARTAARGRRGSTTGSKWPALPAVAKGALFTVDADLLHRAGPRFVAGAEALCAAMDAGRNAAPR